MMFFIFHEHSSSFTVLFEILLSYILFTYVFFFYCLLLFLFFFFFFFSSRRRHTRLTCDWSSDVCSSDLPSSTVTCSATPFRVTFSSAFPIASGSSSIANAWRAPSFTAAIDRMALRSEERRVGKECRSRWAAYE